jgi:hypothetical protein
MESNMDIVLDIKNDKLPLVIVFGSVLGNGLNIAPNEFQKYLNQIFNIHYIFIKDRYQVWYSNGIFGIGNSIDECIPKLKEIISNINYSKIITCGASMGAYAALIFGKLLNVDHILAFSPQTFLDKKTRALYKDNRWEKNFNDIYKLNKLKYSDLSKIDFSTIKNIELFVGKDSKLDQIHILKLKKTKNITLTIVNGGHIIVKGLKESGNLKIIFDNAFKI